ncbi:MAG TPA: M56 family metallopeptidase [Pirellulales bacterium]|nr:M56 family metallopeptidase [Pirellulales bacterium]
MAAMFELLNALSGGAAVLADASVKSAVVLLAAAIAARLLRQAPASVRHRVWSLGLSGALVMPLLSCVLPHLRLPVLPAKATPAETAHHSAVATPTALPGEAAAIDSSVRNVNEEWDVATANPIRAEDLSAAQAALLESRRGEALRASGQTAAPLDARVYVLGVWMAGLAMVLFPLAAGSVVNWRLVRKSRRLTQAHWLRLIAELSARIGLTRTVAAFESPRPVVPMTWGLLRPTVVVPEDWRDWPQERRRCVLLHELAHVKRLDVVFQMIGRLAAAFYWFNPLVWFALRQLRIERELACDDCVLASGERASDYARELLSIAKLYRLRPLAVGVAMAHSARLDQRVLRILDRARSRLPMSRRAARWLFVAAAVLVLAVAATSLVERSTSAVEGAEEQDTDDLSQDGPAGDERRAPLKKDNAAQPGSTDNTKKASSDRPAETKTVRGRVTRGGNPAGGAHVAVIARSTATGRGGDFSSDQSTVLAVATADEQGEYALHLGGVSQKTHRYANLIARQNGSAVTWRQLNLDAPQTEAALELPDEEPIRAKLIDLEGQPASGVRVSIVSVIEPSNGDRRGSGAGYRGHEVPTVWLAPVVSDEQGKFVIHGVAANHGVMLEVAGDDRFAQQEIALNTGWPEQRGERDATYRALVKNAKPGEEAVLTLSPAQTFEGVVKYADTNEPVPAARITIWASQQEFGSMMSVAGRADEKGRYRISPRPGIRFGLAAYPPSGAPYLARETPPDKAIRWQGGERVKQVDLTLPRGVLVRGKVVEAGSDVPVAGAAVQYVPETSNNRSASRDIVTGWQGIEVTDKDGRFAIAVLPGPGRLLVSGPQGNYVFQEIGDRELGLGRPGGTRNYFHSITKLNPEAGQEGLELKIELHPGATVTGRVVDDDANSIEEMLVISRLHISPQSGFWRAYGTPTLGGRFELSGLAKGVEYPVYFLEPKRRLSATRVVKAGDSELTVVLKPCGTATLRALDSKGEPVHHFANVQMVVTPGAMRYDFDALTRGELAADADFIANVDRTNNALGADDEGRLKLPALIPGAAYQVYGMLNEKWLVIKEFQVKTNETVDLGDLVVQDPR